MANCDQVEYYRLRHNQEHARAEQSEMPEVRRVHTQLADAYAKRLEAIDPRPKLSIVMAA